MGERKAGSSPGQGTGLQPTVVAGRVETECERRCPVRDTSKCKMMAAGEYMTPEQTADFKASWDECEYVLRESVGAPDWAHFLDREGTAYSIEALAEEWLREDAEEGEMGARELMLTLSPQVAAYTIMGDLTRRVEAGKLRAVVDSPDDWE